MAVKVKETKDSKGFIYPKGVNQIMIEGVILNVYKQGTYFKGSLGYTGYDQYNSKNFIGFQIYDSTSESNKANEREKFEKMGLVTGAIITCLGDVRYETVKINESTNQEKNPKQPVINIKNFWSNLTDVEIQKLIDVKPTGTDDDNIIKVGKKYTFAVYNDTFDILYRDEEVATDIKYKDFYEKYYGICIGNIKKSELEKLLQEDNIELGS